MLRFLRPAAIAAAALAASFNVASAQQERLAEPATVRMLTVPYFSLESIASEKKLFEKYNLNVEYISQTQNGLAGIQAILAGQVETGQSFGAFVPISITARGGEVQAVAAAATSTYGENRFYTRADSGIAGCADLKGKTIGIINPGSMGDIVLQAYLKTCGLKPADANVITVPLNAMCTSLINKQVDAAGFLSLAWGPCETEHKAEIKQLFADKDVVPADRLYSNFVFTKAYLDQHADVVRAFIAAIREAREFVAANPEEAREIIAKRTGIAANLLVVPEYPANNCIDADAAAQWVSLLEGINSIEAGSVAAGSWFTNAYNAKCTQ